GRFLVIVIISGTSSGGTACPSECMLAADVVGFSRLTGSDEEGTLARLRTLWSDLIAPTIAVHNGRVVKRTGDGSIIEFRSVVDAVRCSIEVAERHGRAQRPSSARAPHRIPSWHSYRRRGPRGHCQSGR